MNDSLPVLQGHVTLSPDLVRFFGLEAQAKAQAIRETESEAEGKNKVSGSKAIKRNEKAKMLLR